MPLDVDAAWWSLPIVMVDFETTGIDPLVCAPVSVAAVRYEAGEEVGHYYSLINPGEPIPASASEIHGITDEQVAGAPTLADCAVELAALAADAAPAAYNASYDRTIFHRYVAGADVPLFDPSVRWICPLVMLRKIDRYAPGAGRHRLATAAKRWAVPLAEADAHNALADARAAGGLLCALVRAGKVNPRTRLGVLLDYLDRCRVEQDADREAYLAKRRARDAQQALPLDVVGR